MGLEAHNVPRSIQKGGTTPPTHPESPDQATPSQPQTTKLSTAERAAAARIPSGKTTNPHQDGLLGYTVPAPQDSSTTATPPLPSLEDLGSPWAGENAWRKLHEALGQHLLRQAQRFTNGDHDAAYDLVQRALLGFFRQIRNDEFRKREVNVPAYLQSSMRNQAINDANDRELRRIQTLSLDATLAANDVNGQYSDISLQAVSPADTEDEAISTPQAKAIISRLQEAGMNPTHLLVLLLHADGLSRDEIAAQLGANPDTVGVQLLRARAAAKKALVDFVAPEDIADRSVHSQGGRKNKKSHE